MDDPLSEAVFQRPLLNVGLGVPVTSLDIPFLNSKYEKYD
ncbi:13389_t:CDS:2 [Rhizophagus irregularis]|nr:13389_t:CDS:2 [Rhizophagus irregularis]